MRKSLILTALALVLTMATAHASSIGVGIGAYGGVSIPILNDLSGQGTHFGVRVPVRVLPLLTVEPYFSTSSLGDVEEAFGGSVTYTRDGGDLSSFGANLTLNFGTPMFALKPLVGLGSYKLERSGADEISEMGYNFGLGLGIGLPAVPGLGVEVRGEFVMVSTGDTSQKFANATGGLTYTLPMMGAK